MCMMQVHVLLAHGVFYYYSSRSSSQQHALQLLYVWMLSQQIASHKSNMVTFRGHGFQQHFAGSGAPRARKRGAKMDPQIGAL